MKKFFSILIICAPSIILNYGLSQTIKEVKIGNQVWMAENLHVFYFRNGDPVPLAKTPQEWGEAGRNKQPACCYYENDMVNGKKFGLLYNWYAVADSRGLAPKGWHVANDDEWTSLTVYLGGDSIAGSKLKSSSGWESYLTEISCPVCKNWTPQQKAGQTCKTCGDTRKIKEKVSGNGTNSSGFDGLPGGFCTEGLFHSIGLAGNWWCLNEVEGSSKEWIRFLYYEFDKTYRGLDRKEIGYSVRCIKD